ncbi:MAG TPA: hypothetical protein VHC91_04430 [Trinickia sp.]|uniref:hypothetical protein n=1 Tax=Trinickia sp. TaxID=2571163 RepID=UPI002C2C3AC4|nr:hypothetical protein [Trinickia sp.]HVW49636.1 hypothetical protein [Trinickia sp.]
MLDVNRLFLVKLSFPGPLHVSCSPLLNIDVATDVGPAHSPYLDAAVLDRMEAICAELIEAFDFEAIDCEWGLETTDGFVSVTTIAPRDRRRANVAHTIGFGFSSAQNTGSRATTLALLPASCDIRLWRGRHLRETKVQRLHLLQARPAYSDAAFRERSALTDECYEALSRHYDLVDAGLLILGTQSSGHALIAPDLMSAWRRYLALEADARRAIAVVIVDKAVRRSMPASCFGSRTSLASLRARRNGARRRALGPNPAPTPGVATRESNFTADMEVRYWLEVVLVAAEGRARDNTKRKCPVNLTGHSWDNHMEDLR